MATFVVLGGAGALASTDRLDRTEQRFRDVIALNELDGAVHHVELVSRQASEGHPAAVSEVGRHVARVATAADSLVAHDAGPEAAALAAEANELALDVEAQVQQFEDGTVTVASATDDHLVSRFGTFSDDVDALEPHDLADAGRAAGFADVAVWVSVILVAVLSGGMALQAERNRQARITRRGENRFRSLVQRASDVLLVVDNAGAVTYASPSTERVLGYVPGSMEQRPVIEFAHPDDIERMAGVFIGLLTSGAADAGTHLFRVRTADGNYRSLEGTASDARDDVAVGGIIVNARDVTDRVAAEEQLRKREASLRLLFESNPQPMWVIDAETLEFLEVNPAAVAHYRIERQAFLERTSLDLHHPDEHDRVREQMARPRETGANRTSGPWRLVRGDGSEVLVELTTHRLDYAGRNASMILAHDVTEQLALQDRLMHQAFHDDLTGLPNRALLRDRIERALASGCRDGRRVGVLFLDLDGFKVVNDSLGHAAGDELLAAVAARLQTCIRPGDSVARLGGDEFAILLLEDHDDRAADAVAARALDVFRTPFEIGRRQVMAGASVGIATGSPSDATADTLLRDADAAMYAAKWSGSGHAQRFEPAMHAEAVERLELSGDLRRALANDELIVHYQPVVALGSGAIEGVEALIRWEHPTRGLVPPLRFIPMAEELGLIIPIGRWVLDQACHQLAAWIEAGVMAPDVSVCVNVSARQLHDDALVQHVSDALAASGLAPSALVLEITETALVQDVEVAALRLGALKALGVKVAVDDFGAGYSSLDYLRRFPVDVLKIDKSFVDGVATGVQGRALVQAIIDLGTSLEMALVAEGIEEVDQLEELRATGCTSGQGYLFARPASASELESLLAVGMAAPA